MIRTPARQPPLWLPLVLLVTASSSEGTTIHVPADEPTIQAGINAAAVIGDTVLVAPGNYFGPGNAIGVTLYKNLVLTSEGGPEVTVIDSENHGGWLAVGLSDSAKISGFTIRQSDAGIWVVDSSPRISNCIFTDCIAGSYSNIVVNGAEAHPVIVDCHFMNSEDDEAGAAIAGGEQSHTTLIGCSFVGNRVRNGHGGACYFVNAAASLVGCEFRGNWAGGSANGGAIGIDDGDVDITNCEFIGNTAFGNGGAVYSSGGELNFTGCILDENEALGGFGGGVMASGSTAMTIEGCTLARNTALAGGSVVVAGSSTAGLLKTIIAFGIGRAVRCIPPAVISISCCDVFGNVGGNWTDCLVGQLGVNGNISADPLFCDIADADFALMGHSPCAPGNSPPGCGLIGALPVGCGIADVAIWEAPSGRSSPDCDPKSSAGSGAVRNSAGCAAHDTTHLRLAGTVGRAALESGWPLAVDARFGRAIWRLLR